MREGAPEVGAVYIGTLLLGDVHVFATGTEHLHSRGADLFAHAYGQDVLTLAEYPGTDAELAEQELLAHDGESLGRKNKSSVDEAVDVGGLLVYLEKALVLELLLVGSLCPEDHFHGFAEWCGRYL